MLYEIKMLLKWRHEHDLDIFEIIMDIFNENGGDMNKFLPVIDPEDLGGERNNLRTGMHYKEYII